jgi:hypothetical protein
LATQISAEVDGPESDRGLPALLGRKQLVNLQLQLAGALKNGGV